MADTRLIEEVLSETGMGRFEIVHVDSLVVMKKGLAERNVDVSRI